MTIREFYDVVQTTAVDYLYGDLIYPAAAERIYQLLDEEGDAAMRWAEHLLEDAVQKLERQAWDHREFYRQLNAVAEQYVRGVVYSNHHDEQGGRSMTQIEFARTVQRLATACLHNTLRCEDAAEQVGRLLAEHPEIDISDRSLGGALGLILEAMDFVEAYELD